MGGGAEKEVPELRLPLEQSAEFGWCLSPSSRPLLEAATEMCCWWSFSQRLQEAAAEMGCCWSCDCLYEAFVGAWGGIFKLGTRERSWLVAFDDYGSVSVLREVGENIRYGCSTNTGSFVYFVYLRRSLFKV